MVQKQKIFATISASVLRFPSHVLLPVRIVVGLTLQNIRMRIVCIKLLFVATLVSSSTGFRHFICQVQSIAMIVSSLFLVLDDCTVKVEMQTEYGPWTRSFAEWQITDEACPLFLLVTGGGSRFRFACSDGVASRVEMFTEGTSVNRFPH